MEGVLPNLLIIGAMKSGTSSLHDYLSLHPEIFMSDLKEIHYFDDDNFLVKNEEWYKSFFKTDKKIIGCSPQNYSKAHNKYYQNIPGRIKELIPDVKLIYIVRDPVERYKSHVLESYYCDPPEDIKYSQESGNYLKTGMYYLQISEYLKFFDMSQIHVLSLEDLVKNKLHELNRVFRFLGVSEMTNESKFDFISNKSESKAHPRVISSSLWFRVGNKLLPGLTAIIARHLAQKFYSIQTRKPQLSEIEELELREQFKDDVAQFRELTGMQFENWSV